jgi:hypothetical protein
MLKKIFLGATLLAACALAPLTADAKPHKHFKHGRGNAYAYGREGRVTDSRWNNRDERNDRNDGNRWRGVSRGVRRGRNWTPGIPRGPLDSRMTPRTFPRDEGRGLGRRIKAREDRHDNRGRGEGVGHGKH